MSTIREPSPQQEVDLRVRAQTAELLRSNEALRNELDELQQSKSELQGRLFVATTGGQADRQTRRAALNLLEDSIEARRQTLEINAELQRKIEEHERSEAALRTSEL